MNVDFRKVLRKNKLCIVVICLILSFMFSYIIFGNKAYMFLSFILIFLVMALFFLSFDKKQPRGREVVIVTTMSSICVALHLGLHLVLPVQIGTAIVFISGAVLGCEKGFIIGALARFVCNFYMGHGPWSPWQMLCWGLVGFVAGIVFKGNERLDMDKRAKEIKNAANKRKLKDINLLRDSIRDSENRFFVYSKSKMFSPLIKILGSVLFSINLMYIIHILGGNNFAEFWGYKVYIGMLLGFLFGTSLSYKTIKATPINMSTLCFITTLVIYGGIMNFSVMINSGESFGIKGLKAIYISGLPYDFYHGISASLCVLLLGDTLSQKLERIKIKYRIG